MAAVREAATSGRFHLRSVYEVARPEAIRYLAEIGLKGKNDRRDNWLPAPESSRSAAGRSACRGYATARRRVSGGAFPWLDSAAPNWRHGALGRREPRLFPAVAAAHIGWQTSPFQFEVGMADLAIGITACLSFWRDLSFKAAAICAGFRILAWRCRRARPPDDYRGQLRTRERGAPFLHGHHLSFSCHFLVGDRDTAPLGRTETGFLTPRRTRRAVARRHPSSQGVDNLR